jgi:predicted nucleic acid binding AN1-type Zn finger protein
MNSFGVKRCNQCNKKTGVMEYKCRCGKQFCISHLQAEKHNCNFDYKTDGKEKIKRENDVGILCDKMIRI